MVKKNNAFQINTQRKNSKNNQRQRTPGVNTENIPASYKYPAIEPRQTQECRHIIKNIYKMIQPLPRGRNKLPCVWRVSIGATFNYIHRVIVYCWNNLFKAQNVLK